MLKMKELFMSRKLLPVMLVLAAASLFLAFRSLGSTNNDGRDNPKSKFSRVLRNVGILLEEGHYSPRKLNDDFSKLVMKKFQEELDGDKNIFLQSDIEGFKKFDSRIDDEIKGSELQSFFAVHDVYQTRIAEVAELYKSILAKPMDFSVNESVQVDGDKLNYSKTAAERNDVWRKRIKYIVLDKYVALLEAREKNKGQKDFVVKADSTLEREARDQARKQIERYFTNKMKRENKDEIFSTFVNAITNTMDPHTDYFPPVDLRSFNEGMSGRFFGIGAVIKEEDGKIKIGPLMPGGPAWKSGEIKENDEVLKIGQGAAEPVDVTGYASYDVVKMIRGSEKGSEVRFTLRKIDGSIKVVALKRDEIKMEEVFAKSAVIKGEHKIGYIYLPEFYADFERPGGARCAVDVAKEVEKLKAEKVDGIVIDLRGNGGGSLSDAVQMAGLFIEDGPVCQVRSRGDRPNVLRDKDKNILYDGPLTVMVDETSASASEIFAAAMQDYKRGIVIGSSTTYGKGTVQRNISLNPEPENNLFTKSNTEDLGTVKLTLQKFYRVNGGSTQLKGMTPDIVIPDRLEAFKIREKDNPSSLTWDEIPQADIKPWNSSFSLESVASEANRQVASNEKFALLRKTVQDLYKLNEKETSLNLQRYREEQKQMRSYYKILDSVYKQTTALDVKNNEVDAAGLAGAPEDKTVKNKQWLKKLSDDIYITEAVKVMNNMIGQASRFAKKD
jgi:carboxyl-terminal processing protease